MLLGRKKPVFQARAVDLPEDWLAAGCSILTDRRSMTRDSAALQKQYLSRLDKLRDVRSPWACVVVAYPEEAGKLRLFTGQLVDSAENNQEHFTIVRIPAGPYARITVDYRSAVSWPVDVARARRYYWQQWLKESGREPLDTFQDLEYYDQRSRISLASMDLYFPLKKES